MFHTPRWCLEVFFFVFFASYTDSFPVVFSFLFIFFLSFILLLFFSSGFHPILPLSFFTFLLLYFGFCSSLSFVFSFFSLSIQLFSSLSFSPFLFSGFPQFEFLLSFLSSDICLISFPFFAFHLLFLTLSFSSPLLLSIFLYCSALLFPLSFAQLLFPLLLSFLPFSVYCFLFSVPFLSFPLLSCPFLSFPFPSHFRLYYYPVSTQWLLCITNSRLPSISPSRSRFPSLLLVTPVIDFPQQGAWSLSIFLAEEWNQSTTPLHQWLKMSARWFIIKKASS